MISNEVRKNINDITFLLNLNSKSFRRSLPFSNPISVEITFVFNNSRSYKLRDLDNMFKTLGDCLEKAGIIKNDRLIIDLRLRKVLDKKEKTLIKIEEIQNE